MLILLHNQLHIDTVDQLLKAPHYDIIYSVTMFLDSFKLLGLDRHNKENKFN